MERFNTYFITPLDFEKAGSIATDIKNKLNKMGIDQAIIRRVVIACYEAEINTVIHSYGGVCNCTFKNGSIILNFSDFGPGIDDIELAMQPGFSTAKEEAIRNGFGGGMGLENIKSVSDQFFITSTKDGTSLRIIIDLKEGIL